MFEELNKKISDANLSNNYDGIYIIIPEKDDFLIPNNIEGLKISKSQLKTMKQIMINIYDDVKHKDYQLNKQTTLLIQNKESFIYKLPITIENVHINHRVTVR